MLRDATEREELKKIRALYEEAFPKSEKKPFRYMLKKRKEGFFDILAIEDEEGAFCGLAIMMLSGGLALLDYLAVSAQCRGKGVGSAVLEELRNRYGQERLVIEIESTVGLPEDAGTGAANVTGTASATGAANIPGNAEVTGTANGTGAAEIANAGERLRRKAFYLRNGWRPVEFQVELFGVDMEVLTYGRALTFGEYYSLYENVLPARLAKRVKLKTSKSQCAG